MSLDALKLILCVCEVQTGFSAEVLKKRFMIFFGKKSVHDVCSRFIFIRDEQEEADKVIKPDSVSHWEIYIYKSVDLQAFTWMVKYPNSQPQQQMNGEEQMHFVHGEA